MEDSPLRFVDTLDFQLASVVEQDGVILNTPLGVKRRSKSKARSAKRESGVATPDHIASLDHEIVNLVIAERGGVAQSVVVTRDERPRSQYVISLQNVVFSRQRERDERLHVFHDTSPIVSAVSIHAYAAHTSDLSFPREPWASADQFTPATFTEAYRAVYGSFDRAVGAWREAVIVVVGLFHRVEEIEARTVEDVKDAIGVIDVPRFSMARALVAFAGLALVVTLPANAVALYRTASSTRADASVIGHAAIADLLAAKDATSLPDSASAFRRASSQFRALDGLLSDANTLALGAASFVSGKVRTARVLADVGAASSDAARLIALGLDKVFADPDRRFDERLDVLGAYSRAALTLLGKASRSAATIDPTSLPNSERDRVTRLLATLAVSTDAVREFAALSDALAQMVGTNGLRKYLFIFQNQTELRPTGGFMGSFAEVTMDRGAVTSIRVPPGGTYELKGMLLARVAPPKPLGLVTNIWQFQDTNWFPDFPTTAKKIRWFWSKSRQSTIDGVVAVNASLIERLLVITGPIELPAYGKTIDASNFLLETQKAVEIEYDKTANTPKKFIGDLTTAMLDRLKGLPKDAWLAVAGVVSDALDRKDVQVAFFKPEEAELADRYGWNGRLKVGAGDELGLIEANIAGQKTDGVISESVDHQVAIREDGTIEDTVTLTRTHGGKKGELFRGVRNVSYLRVYVPLGSTLRAARGFSTPDASLFKSADTTTSLDPDVLAIEYGATETPAGVTVSTEGSRTTFGGWLQLDPGASQIVTLTYRLPFAVSDIARSIACSEQSRGDCDSATTSREPRRAYLLHLISQSGRPRRLTTSVSLPAKWSLIWKRPDDIVVRSASIEYRSDWDRDRTIALLFAPHDEIASTHKGN